MDYSKNDGKQWAKEKLIGQWTTMATPFSSDGEIDLNALEKNIGHVLKLGTSGMGFSWNMGEFWSLTNEERFQLMETAPGLVKGKAKMAFQVTTNCIKDAVQMANKAEELGYDFVIMGPPFIMTKKEEQVIDFIRRVSERISIGIAFYNSPQFGIVMSANGLSKLAEIKNVLAIKEASFNMQLSIDTHLSAGEKVVVSVPDEEIFFYEQYYGFHQQAMFANTSDWRFDTSKKHNYVDFIDHATKQDYKLLPGLYEKIRPVKMLSRKWWSRVAARTGGSLPVAMVKHWGELMGMSHGDVRPPLMSLTTEEKDEMKRDLKSIGLI